MLVIKKIIINNILQPWLWAFILLILSVAPIEKVIAPGIDASYMFAFNYFFTNDIQIGKDILFTFGPLGFLLWPQSQGNNLIIAMFIVYGLKYIFIYFSLTLYYFIQIKMSYMKWTLISIPVYAIASIISTHDLFIFITFLLISISLIRNQIRWLIGAGICVGVALLVKASAGIISLLLLLSLVLYYVWNKNYKYPIYMLLSTVFTFLFIWMMMYGNLEGSYTYLYATLELSSGNSTAMTINPNNNWWILSLFVISLLTYIFRNSDKILVVFATISFLSLMAVFKYAIAREDHIFYFVDFLVYYLFLIFLLSKKFTLKNFIHIFIIYLLFLGFIYKTPYKDRIKSHLSNYLNSWVIYTESAYKFEENSIKLKKQSQMLLHPLRLDNEDRNILGNQSVDVYPWNIAYIAANTLNWRPRPVFQSYIAYTDYLDNKNALFFKSKNAPKYIIWHKLHWGGELGSIDGRYLFNDEPLTILTLLANYKVIKNKSTYIILERSSNKMLIENSVKQSYKWNEWLSVPKIPKKTILRAKVDIERSFKQKIKKLVYKEFKVFIGYKLKDGSEQHYRLVVDNAKNGLWINPLFETLFTYQQNNEVTHIKFVHHKYDYFSENIEIEWEMISPNKPFFE